MKNQEVKIEIVSSNFPTVKFESFCNQGCTPQDAAWAFVASNNLTDVKYIVTIDGFSPVTCSGINADTEMFCLFDDEAADEYQKEFEAFAY